MWEAILEFIQDNFVSFLAAASAGLGIFCLVSAIGLGAVGQRQKSFESLLEQQRITKLRNRSSTFYFFEPWIANWIPFTPPESSTATQRLQLALDMLPDTPPWRAREYGASKMIEAFLVTLFFGVVCGIFFGLIGGVIVGGIFGGTVYVTSMSSPQQKLKASRKRFIRRLPFAVDLLALMIDAGGQFVSSLEALVREEKDNEIGVYFGQVLNELQLGSTMRPALQGLANRLDDPDVYEFVFAVVKGDELGTPIAQIFRTQSEQMKMKRSQMAEKASADAQINMTGPAFVVMLICIVVMAGPIVMGLIPMLTEP